MVRRPPMFVPINWNGRKLKVMRIINDKKYGEIWDSFLDHEHVYILNGDKLEVVEDQVRIDELDDLYGIPVRERGLLFD